MIIFRYNWYFTKSLCISSYFSTYILQKLHPWIIITYMGLYFWKNHDGTPIFRKESFRSNFNPILPKERSLSLSWGSIPFINPYVKIYIVPLEKWMPSWPNKRGFRGLYDIVMVALSYEISFIWYKSYANYGLLISHPQFDIITHWKIFCWFSHCLFRLYTFYLTLRSTNRAIVYE